MSELHLLCDNLFARCEDPAPDGVRGSRLMQPLSDRKGFELKTFPKDARDIFLIGWQLENGNALMENNSMGWYEAKDLEAIARFYREKLGVNAILGIHGGGDFFVPTHMTKDMYGVKQGRKKLKIYGKSFHACSQFMHLKEYKKDVADFLKENGID